MDNLLTVKDIISPRIACEDAVLLKGYIKDHLDENVTLDFSGLGDIPTTFFYNMLSDMIYSKGRDYVYSHIVVKNLSNPSSFEKVVLGSPCF